MISAWWLVILLPLAASFGAVVMGAIAGGKDEELRAAACDNCYWLRYFKSAAALERRCKRCVVTRG